jgi:antitoxin ChpS
MMTVPKAFIEQNQLQEGAQVELMLEGARMTVIAPRERRYRLEALLAEMPEELPRVEGWDAMEPVGKELA